MAASSRIAKTDAPVPDPSSDTGWARPWTPEEDLSDWETVATSSDRHRRPAGLALTLELSAVHAEWIRRAAREASVDYVTFIERLIENARAAADRPAPDLPS
jgi:hypothetical protein